MRLGTLCEVFLPFFVLPLRNKIQEVDVQKVVANEEIVVADVSVTHHKVDHVYWGCRTGHGRS